MKKTAIALWCVCVALLLGSFAPSARALFIEFNFNSLSDGANNTAVKKYMRGVLNTAMPGATLSALTGALGEKNYTGDSHVVGPVTGSTATPLTLGNTDGGVQHTLPWDTYLINNTSDDRITMVFSFPIYRVSFDYEIFPDGTCPDGGSNGCPNTTDTDWPDFKFRAGSISGTLLIFEKDALDPSADSTMVYRESPVSDGVSGYEKAPQLLAQSGDWYFPGGVTKLEFVDWPRHIGIDNLHLWTDVPEPSSLALLGLGLAGLWMRRRKSRGTADSM